MANGSNGGGSGGGDVVQAPGHPGRRRLLTLTNRERQVACLRRDGLSASQIADRLKLTQGTVEGYFEVIGSKTGTHNVAQLIQWLQDERNQYANTYCRCGTPVPLGRNRCQTCLDRDRSALLVPVEVEHGIAELYVLARTIAEMPVDDWLARFPEFIEGTATRLADHTRIRKLLVAGLELKRVTEELAVTAVSPPSPSPAPLT